MLTALSVSPLLDGQTLNWGSSNLFLCAFWFAHKSVLKENQKKNVFTPEGLEKLQHGQKVNVSASYGNG